MVWTIIIGLVLFIGIRFLLDLDKDKHDLAGTDLSNKFEIVTNIINEAAFNGRGSVTKLDKRSYNLYEEGENQIINFHYSTGHLKITWKYKYFQKEIVHEKQFDYVRNISVFDQQRIAQRMISEMNNIVSKHKNNVLGGL